MRARPLDGIVTNGYRINDETWRPRSGVPLLGEQSREILKELNFTDEQIASFIERGIVKQA